LRNKLANSKNVRTAKWKQTSIEDQWCWKLWGENHELW